MIFGSRDPARRNIQESEKARKILTRIKKRSSPWMRISKTDLRKMVPPPEVPQAFNSSFLGCPEHGMDLYKYGNYAWIIEPFKRPWKLKCPIGGEEYPSNDFQAFLDSKLSDRSLLGGPYPDDGWGLRRRRGTRPT